jgi:hypothetical protein
MFQLLYPIGLLAAIGIALPILIHLWNIKSGKTLKIGSVAFLGVPSNQQSRSLKITDWPLLLLRCLLICLLAFLLARPAQRQKIQTSEQPGWVLVEKANFKKLWGTKRKQLDSLITKGYEIHDFDVNFNRLELKDTLSDLKRSSNPPLPYYSLIKQLDSQMEPGKRVYLYTDNGYFRFQGKQPVVHMDLRWAFLPNARKDTTWVANQYQTSNRMVKSMLAHSNSAGTYYTAALVKPAEATGAQVDTSSIVVQIYQKQASGDAAYLKAAVLALRQFTSRKIELQNISSLKQINKNKSLVFWLSEQQPSSADITQLPKGTTFFAYAGSKVTKEGTKAATEGMRIQKVNSMIQDQNGVALEDAELYKRTEPTTTTAQNVWLDAAGSPVLSLDATSGVNRYQFYSRFRPDWNNLAWTNGMVLFLTPIILPQAAAQAAFKEDPRSLSAATMQRPLIVENSANAVSNSYVQHSLSPWFWWICLILLFLERWLSYRKNVQQI